MVDIQVLKPNYLSMDLGGNMELKRHQCKESKMAAHL